MDRMDLIENARLLAGIFLDLRGAYWREKISGPGAPVPSGIRIS
jgi:hypothetical protein